MKVAAWLGRVMLAWLLLATPVHAQMYPKPIGYVSDFAQLLSVSERTQLNDNLAGFDKGMACQIVVVTVADLRGMTIDAYTLGLARQWGVGTRDTNCGIVVAVSRVTREIRVEVGTGLTSTLTTQRVARVVAELFVPRFRNEQWFLGLHEGIDGLKLLIAQHRERR